MAKMIHMKDGNNGNDNDNDDNGNNNNNNNNNNNKIFMNALKVSNICLRGPEHLRREI